VAFSDGRPQVVSRSRVVQRAPSGRSLPVPHLLFRREAILRRGADGGGTTLREHERARTRSRGMERGHVRRSSSRQRGVFLVSVLAFLHHRNYRGRTCCEHPVLLKAALSWRGGRCGARARRPASRGKPGEIPALSRNGQSPNARLRSDPTLSPAEMAGLTSVSALRVIGPRSATWSVCDWLWWPAPTVARMRSRCRPADPLHFSCALPPS